MSCYKCFLFLIKKLQVFFFFLKTLNNSNKRNYCWMNYIYSGTSYFLTCRSLTAGIQQTERIYESFHVKLIMKYDVWSFYFKRRYHNMILYYYAILIAASLCALFWIFLVLNCWPKAILLWSRIPFHRLENATNQKEKL